MMDETADYIADLAEQLRELAVAAERPFLAFLIAMVVEEAKEECRCPSGWPGD